MLNLCYLFNRFIECRIALIRYVAYVMMLNLCYSSNKFSVTTHWKIRHCGVPYLVSMEFSQVLLITWKISYWITWILLNRLSNNTSITLANKNLSTLFPLFFSLTFCDISDTWYLHIFTVSLQPLTSIICDWNTRPSWKKSKLKSHALWNREKFQHNLCQVICAKAWKYVRCLLLRDCDIFGHFWHIYIFLIHIYCLNCWLNIFSVYIITSGISV